MASEHAHFSLDDIVGRIATTIGRVFVPIMPALMASGLLIGLTEGLNTALAGTLATNPWWILLHICATASFIFLQILIGFSAARVFGGNEFLGGVIGMITNHTALVNAWSIPVALTRFGSSAYQTVGSDSAAQWLSLVTGTTTAANGATSGAIMGAGGVPQVALVPGMLNVTLQGYQGHVIAIVLAVYVMSKIEAWLHERVPDMVDLFVTPLVTVLVTGLITTIIIGPFFSLLEGFTMSFFQFLLSIPFGIGGGLAGAIYPLTEVLGLHHLFDAFEASMCALTPPSDTFNPIVCAAHMAQAAACLAVCARTLSAEKRNMALPSGVAALLGVTEPAVFGINLPAIRPFFGAIAGSAIGGVLASILGVHSTDYGVTGVVGYLITSDTTLFTVVIAAAFIVSFAITFSLYQDDEETMAMIEHEDEAPVAAQAEAEEPAEEPTPNTDETPEKAARPSARKKDKAGKKRKTKAKKASREAAADAPAEVPEADESEATRKEAEPTEQEETQPSDDAKEQESSPEQNDTPAEDEHPASDEGETSDAQAEDTSDAEASDDAAQTEETPDQDAAEPAQSDDDATTDADAEAAEGSEPEDETAPDTEPANEASPAPENDEAPETDSPATEEASE